MSLRAVRISSLVLLAMVCASSSHSSPAQEKQSPFYPDSAEGLRLQLEDLISAYKSGDQSAFQSRLDALAIPAVKDWLASHFSPMDGSKLERDYSQLLKDFRGGLTELAKKEADDSALKIIVMPSELPAPSSGILADHGLPSPVKSPRVESFIYIAGSQLDERPSFRSGAFAYVDGRFCYAGYAFPFYWNALNKGNLTAAHLVQRTSPQYPKTARKKLIEGDVRIFGTIGTDGTLHNSRVVQGDPLFSEAALKAAGQWRYQPALLSGVPVEVGTIVEVKFQLKDKP